MRAARLLSTLLLLQARGQLTAAEIAAELDVSIRTVYRDLDDLGAAGVPVYGERGKGGGYRLLDGYRTNLTGLTAEEAGAMLLSGAPGPAAELGLGTILATTRLKLLAAVPPGLREVATRAEQGFHLDPAGWAHDRARDDRFLKDVARAVWNDRRLQIGYRRPEGRLVQREIDPLGLVHKTGVWYLVACHEGAARVYRVDRIEEAREIGEAAQRPPDFDLVPFWEGWEAEYAASLPAFAARVRLGPEAQQHRDDLGALNARAVTEHGETADGWVEQTLLFDTRRVAVAALLALAPEVEVIAPDELRDDLATVARQVIARNRHDDGATPDRDDAGEQRGDPRPLRTQDAVVSQESNRTGQIGNPFAHQAVSARYARGRPYFHPEVIDRVRERLSLREPVERALDVGCGTGQSTLALRRLARHVVGVDASPEMLAHAPQANGMEYMVAPAERLPFPDETFDIITAAAAFHWFDRAEFLDEACRLLRPSAWLVIYDNAFQGRMDGNRDFAQWTRDVYARRFPAPPRDRRPLTAEEAARHGLRDVAHEEYTNRVSFSPDEVVAYLMTQSNVTAAVEGGKERPEDVAGWLSAEIGTLFSGSRGTFQFGGDIRMLQKQR